MAGLWVCFLAQVELENQLSSLWGQPKLSVTPGFLARQCHWLFPVNNQLCLLYSLFKCCCTMQLPGILMRLLVRGAAAAAKSLQSCPTLCDPIDGSPPGSPVPGILQARTLEWVAISFSNAWKQKVKVKSLSHVWLLATPWTADYQAPLSMGFARQECWSGVPLPWFLHFLHFVFKVSDLYYHYSELFFM